MNRSISEDLDFLFPLPAYAGSGYIASGTFMSCGTVALLRKDFTTGRIIWRQGGSDRPYAQVDPMGEYVAWRGALGPSCHPWGLLFKPLRDPASTEPRVVSKPYYYAEFCDWTEDGNLLVMLLEDWSSPRWRLVVMDRYGKIVREIRQFPLGLSPRPTAAWRKYMHQ